MTTRQATRPVLLLAAAAALVLLVAGSASSRPLGASHRVHAASAPTISSVTPSLLGQGGRRLFTINGANFAPGAVVSVSGTGVSAHNTTVKSSTRITTQLRATVSATVGARDITVTNPADGSDTCTGCVTIDPGPKPTSTNPNSALPGDTLDVDILGSDFQNGAKSQFGAHITVHSTTFVNSGKLTAHITVQSSAIPGPRQVVVVNPDKGRGSCKCFTVTSPNQPPVPGSPTHNVLGNVRIQVAAPGVLAGATDPNGDNISATPALETTTHGGDYTVNADGAYAYNPPAGYEGSDSIPFQICDDGSPVMCANGSVSLTVSGMIWFVDSSQATNGDGRLTSPLNCLTGTGCFSALNDGVGNDPAAGDNVFLYSGNYTGGVTLLDNQKLIGQGASASLATVAGVTVPADSNSLPTTGGTNPAITTVAASTNGVNLGSGNTLRGFDIGNTTGSKISGSSFGTLTASEMTLSGTGQALNLSTGTANATFAAVSSGSSPAEGIKLATVAGTLTANGGTLQDATNADVDINGGAGTFTYKGSIIDDLGRLVSIANTTGGTKDFTGSITDLDNGTGTGISLTSNSGATITFEGGLTLSTGANPAFTATGGGTVNATQDNSTIINKITTTTGTPLDVESTTIGASGLTFRSISANGGSHGIVLDTTGSSGGLSVTGTGTANSGGMIQAIGAAASDLSTNNCGSASTSGGPAGVGVFLNSTKNVSLAYMNFPGTFGNFGILGYSVNGFTLDNTTMTGTYGNNVNVDEDTVHFCTLTGSASITNDTISNGAETNLRVVNASGTLNRLTLSNSTIGLNQTNGGVGTLFEADGGTFNATVEDTTFQGARGSPFAAAPQAGSTMDLVFGAPGHGNTIHNTHGNIVPFAQDFNLAVGGTATFDINSNHFDSASAVQAQGGVFINSANSTGVASGYFRNNTIGSSGVADSGSSGGDPGLDIESNGGGDLTIKVDNNQMYQWGANGAGFLLQAGSTSGNPTTFQATVTNNTIAQPGTFAVSSNAQGFQLNNGTSSGENFTTCLGFSGNMLNGSGTGAGGDSRFRQRFDTKVQMPGYTGAADGGTLFADVRSYIQGVNPTGPPTVTGVSSTAGGGGFFNTPGPGNACALPSF